MLTFSGAEFKSTHEGPYFLVLNEDLDDEYNDFENYALGAKNHTSTLFYTTEMFDYNFHKKDKYIALIEFSNKSEIKEIKNDKEHYFEVVGCNVYKIQTIESFLNESESEDIRASAVCENGNNIKYISKRNRTPILCKIAVQDCPTAIKHLNYFQRENVIEYALKSVVEQFKEKYFSSRYFSDSKEEKKDDIEGVKAQNAPLDVANSEEIRRTTEQNEVDETESGEYEEKTKPTEIDVKKDSKEEEDVKKVVFDELRSNTNLEIKESIEEIPLASNPNPLPFLCEDGDSVFCQDEVETISTSSTTSSKKNLVDKVTNLENMLLKLSKKFASENKV